ncbi:hypothetical protein Ancab_038644 [Ancistrocladus abbreviatus]
MGGSTLVFWEVGFFGSPIGANHDILKTNLTSGPQWNTEFIITVDAGTTAFEGYGSFVLQDL